tara:strand:- start:4600 stop:4938 length:339 start_codon:yes stop_codon:yes gene_type:complete
MDPLIYAITTIDNISNFGIDLVVETLDFTIQSIRQIPDLINQTLSSYKGDSRLNVLKGTGFEKNLSQMSKMFWKKYDTSIVNYRKTRREQKQCKLSKVRKDGLISFLDVEVD